MKALTLTQPYGSLVAAGAKLIDTRSWQTRYRGPVAIHAAKGFPAAAKRLCEEPVFDNALRKALGWPAGRLWRLLPLGAVVATAVLVDVAPIGGPESFRTGVLEGDEGDFPDRPVLVRREATLSWDPPAGTLMLDDPKRGVVDVSSEIPFGDYTPGRWGWLLADVVPLATPIPAKGALGLWEWNDSKMVTA